MCSLFGIVDLENTKSMDYEKLCQVQETIKHTRPACTYITKGAALSCVSKKNNHHKNLAICTMGHQIYTVAYTGVILGVHASPSLAHLKTADNLALAYQAFGGSIIDHIHGDFSLCIYDKENSRLVLARGDGNKSWFYSILDTEVVFSSTKEKFKTTSRTTIYEIERHQCVSFTWSEDKVWCSSFEKM